MVITMDNDYGTGRKDWMEIFEPSKKDGTLRSNNSVFTPPANCNMKGRDFKGSCTKKGNAYGPANAPKVTSGGGFTDYGPNDPVSTISADGGAMGGGDAGAGGMGESREDKFISFLESMKSGLNESVIETIKSGFVAIVENYTSLEDAMEAEVTKAEAKAEIKKHKLEWNDFIEEVGDKELYSGSEVLEWLGY